MSTSTLEQLRTEKRDAILTLAEKHGINNVRVFGSVAREEDTSNSDIDFLVDLDADADLFKSFSFQLELEDTLHKKVDVIVEECLLPYTKFSILADAKLL